MNDSPSFYNLYYLEIENIIFQLSMDLNQKISHFNLILLNINFDKYSNFISKTLLSYCLKQKLKNLPLSISLIIIGKKLSYLKQVLETVKYFREFSYIYLVESNGHLYFY